MISVLSTSNLSLASLTVAFINVTASVPFFLASVTLLKSMLSGLFAVSLNNAPVSISLCPPVPTIDDSFLIEIDAFSGANWFNIVIVVSANL